jgi:hypothetical protein
MSSWDTMQTYWLLPDLAVFSLTALNLTHAVF